MLTWISVVSQFLLVSKKSPRVEKLAKMMRPPEPPEIRDEGQSEVNNNALMDGLEDLDYVEKIIHVRTRKVGYLIGTAGRTIQGFETNSGAKIDILKPNSCADETPILLSGPSECVRNVLRMIIDLYHLNNLSSSLWQHLRRNHHSKDGGHQLFAHEEKLVQSEFIPSLQKCHSELEAETGAHIEIGKEREDNPGFIPIGVIGTAEQNGVAMEKLETLYNDFLTEQESLDEDKEGNISLEAISSSEEDDSEDDPNKVYRSLPVCNDSYKEVVTYTKETEIDYDLLQPICKLNSVMMETLSKEEEIQIVICGPEINVKRARLQVEHNIPNTPPVIELE